MQHQDLPVAVGAGADADGRYGHLPGDQTGHLPGYALEHDGEAAGVDQGAGVVEQGAGGLGLLALHPVAPESVHRLGREPEVAHNGDLSVDQGLYDRHPGPAALELDRVRPCPDEDGGIADRLFGGQVVAHPRQVGHQ